MSDRLRWGVPLSLVPVYVGLAWLGRELGVFDTLSVFYLPAGLAVGLGAVFGWRALPAMSLGEFVGGIVVFGIADAFSPPQMVVNAIGYATVYVGAGALLSRRWNTGRMGSVESAAIWVTAAGAVAPALAAMFGMGMQVVADLSDAGTYWRDVAIWATGDAIGVLTLGPATAILTDLTGITGVRRVHRGLTTASWPATVATVLSPSIVAALLFAWKPNDTTYFLFLILLPVALVAVRHGGSGVALSVLVLSPVVTALGNDAVGDLVLERIDLQMLLLSAMALGYILGAATDDRSRTERLLRESEQHLDEAQRLAMMGSYEYRRRDGRVRWSDNLHRLYDVPEDASVSVAAYLAQIHEDDRDRIAAAVAATLEEGEPFDHEYRALDRPDGSARWMHARGDVLCDAKGRVIGLTGYCQDVTSRHEVEATLQEAAEREMVARLREVEAAERLREVDATKDALLMAVSHEVRTPLTIVRGLATTLRRPGMLGTADGDDLLVRLDRQAARLEQLLDDLLDVDRLGRGDVQPLRQVCDLRRVVQVAVTSAWTRDDEVELDLQCEQAYVDGRLVERIVSNFVSNADRYAGDHGPIRVWTASEADQVIIGVDDRGEGVAADKREEIFDPFTQASRVEHSPGTGVGLYLVARFARLHGGRAWVEASPLGGASFRVSLTGAVVGRSDLQDAGFDG